MPQKFPKEYARQILQLLETTQIDVAALLVGLDLPLSLLKPAKISESSRNVTSSFQEGSPEKVATDLVSRDEVASDRGIAGAAVLRKPLESDSNVIDFDVAKSILEDEMISAKDLSYLIMESLRHLETHRLGPEKAETLWELSTYRLMFEKMLRAKNLSEAIGWCTQFYRTFYRFEANSVSLERHGQWAKIVIPRSCEQSSPESDINAVDYFTWEACNLLTDPKGICLTILFLHRLFSWIIGEFIEIDSIKLLDAPSDFSRESLQYCHTNVLYRQEELSFTFSIRYLDFKPAMNEGSIDGIEHELFYYMMTIDEQRNSLSMKIRSILGNDFSQGAPSIEWIADRINLSVTTLYRRLKEEGTSFRRIKDECRLESAKTLLSNESVVLADVAHLTGFSDISTFYRAFKKWTGMTPIEYKDRCLLAEVE